MPEFLSLQCLNCRTQYAVPDVYKPHIEGRAVLCPACRKSWVPIPGSDRSGSIESSRVDLRKFRRPSGAAGPAAATGPGPAAATGPGPAAAAPASPANAPQAGPSPWNEAGQGATAKIPVASAPATGLSLRVAVSGPDANITGVFDLGSKAFLIGRKACHLRLPKAPIPDRAIEIRKADEGFIVSGIEGFPLPLGSMSAPSALVIPGQSVRLALVPYSLELQASNTPGSPLKDIVEPSQAPPSPVMPQPPKPRPARPQPVVAGAGSADNMRDQIQELAVDVRPDQGAFGGGGPTSLLDEIDGDMTITDMGAMGIHAQRPNADPFQNLDISLERADGPQQGLKFKVTKSPLIIGRSDLGLTIKDQRVSSKHAQLDISGPWVYTLKDLASTNGTTVNGRPISVAQLGDGDLVSFGGVTFKFKAQKRQ